MGRVCRQTSTSSQLDLSDLTDTRYPYIVNQ
jgi:hypothetical protein